MNKRVNRKLTLIRDDEKGERADNEEIPTGQS